MDFKDWLSSDCSEIWTSDGMDGARQAWDYKQEVIDELQGRIDKALKLMNHPDFGHEDVVKLICDILNPHVDGENDDL